MALGNGQVWTADRMQGQNQQQANQQLFHGGKYPINTVQYHSISINILHHPSFFSA
jgi:anthranilate/para-aminobenzoate synthase component II